jgi:phosphoribosylglycinamide formyltransferase-1
MTQHVKMPVVVLISGGGSNLQALIDGAVDGYLPIELRAVVSNEPDAFGLQRASAAGIETQVLSHRQFDGREAYDQALMELIDGFTPGLVVLAGFMRILTPAFVDHYRGRLLNIHPSLLPRFRGLHTHQRVLESGDLEHGASVHFVTEELDGGPLVLQVRVPIQADDDADALAARVLKHEHRIYPQVVRWFAEGRLRMAESGDLVLDDGVLAAPVVWTSDLPETD